ncbi:MAG: crossover junction endodeoxyribonuclease RuvC [Syntrophomonadaceae bacterium]|jgi:crossover junction endodeoxyribonuclease RuvC
MLVLGIDPGTATTGYGLVENKHGRETLVAYGTINTPSTMAMPLRLLKINQELMKLINQFQPDAAGIEELFYQKNSKTVITVAQSRGVAMMTAAGAGLPVAEYTPLQVKQAVVGYGNADKRQVQLMVKNILAMDTMPRPDDAADALAVAICHLHSCRVTKLMQGKD